MTMKLRRILLTGGLATALAGSATLAACGDDHAGHDAGASAGASTPTTATVTPTSPSTDAAAVDAAFVRQMVPHHEMAVEMAERVRETATHQEIKDLAGDVIDAQSAEIKTLQGKAEDLGVDLDDPGAALEADAQTLGLAPDKLGMEAHHLHADELSERAFIDGMIPHHEGAIAMANAQLEAGEDAKLKNLSRDIIVAQQREIEQLTEWRDEWYGGEPVDAAPPTTSAHGGSHGGAHE